MARTLTVEADMPVDDDVRAEELAAATDGLSGAEVEHVASEAGLTAIKEAVTAGLQPDAVRVRREHFARTVSKMSGGVATQV